MIKRDYFDTHYQNVVGNLDSYYDREIKRYKANFDNILKSLPKDCEILDLACGVGNFVAYLKNHEYRNITAVDRSKESIKIAKKTLQKLNFKLVK